jgi:inhibitor of cysteine peptidase
MLTQGGGIMRLMAFVTVTFFLLVSFVASPAWTKDKSSEQAKPQPAEYSDPAKPITKKVGEEFIIALESNRTTGYGWQLAEPPDKGVLKLQGSEYKAPEAGRPGQGGKEFFTFRAVGQGKAKIALNYVRPWEKNVAPAKSLTFTVEVQ